MFFSKDLPKKTPSSYFVSMANVDLFTSQILNCGFGFGCGIAVGRLVPFHLLFIDCNFDPPLRASEFGCSHPRQGLGYK